jgi:hypothetical protein
VSKLYIATRSGIHEHAPIGVCRVPTKEGRVCGKPFFPGEERAQANHAAACARENAEYVQAYLDRLRPDVMKPWDTELDAWVGQHRQALIEGRMKI